MQKIVKNPDSVFYEKITKAVKDNSNYCPCMIQKTQDTLSFVEQYSMVRKLLLLRKSTQRMNSLPN